MDVKDLFHGFTDPIECRLASFIEQIFRLNNLKWIDRFGSPFHLLSPPPKKNYVYYTTCGCIVNAVADQRGQLVPYMYLDHYTPFLVLLRILFSSL